MAAKPGWPFVTRGKGGMLQSISFVICPPSPFLGSPRRWAINMFSFSLPFCFFNIQLQILSFAGRRRRWRGGILPFDPLQVYYPFYKRFMITDKAGFDAKVKSILDWGIELIIPCHGNVVRNGASEVFREMLLGAGPQ